MQFDCCIQDAINDSTLPNGEIGKTLSSVIKVYDDTQYNGIDLYKKKCCDIQDLLCDQQQKRMRIMRGTTEDIKATAISLKKKSKKIVYKIGEILRRNGYIKIEVVAHARIALVRFRDPSQSIDIDLTLNGKLALHNSDLIKAYMTADSTGKVKKVALLVKALSKAHGMGDASTGKLSSYCWVVLLLHTLMIHNFLPGFSPIKGKYEYRKPEPGCTNTSFCDGFFVKYSVPHVLPVYYQRRLASVSIGELFLLFTTYLTTRVNIQRDCLTLRGRGEVIKKTCWSSSTDFDWRLSIEDPFERADSVLGHDLGRSIQSQRIQENMFEKLTAIRIRLEEGLSGNKKRLIGGSNDDPYGIFSSTAIDADIVLTRSKNLPQKKQTR